MPEPLTDVEQWVHSRTNYFIRGDRKCLVLPSASIITDYATECEVGLYTMLVDCYFLSDARLSPTISPGG